MRSLPGGSATAANTFDSPLVGVAVAARFEGAVCAEAHVVLQAVATHPLALAALDETLRSQRWTTDLLEAAAEEAYRAAHPVDNTSGTIALRRRMVRAYIRRALEARIHGHPWASMGIPMGIH